MMCTRGEVLAVLSAAEDLILDEDFGADKSLASQVINGIDARLTAPGPYNHDDVMGLANAVAEDILDTKRFEIEYSATIRDRSMIDLTVNVIAAVLDHPGISLDDAIRDSWMAEEPYDDPADMVRDWLA